MRVLRGRAEDVDADRQVSADLLATVGETGEPAVRVWRPHRQVAFGRRDVRADGYERARETAREHGFPPAERSVGGRAVAYTGTTVAFARAVPVEDYRQGLDERYEATARTVQRALWRLGVPAQRGEPDGSFCPGQRSLSYRGKVVGIAQRVQADAAVVAGILIVDAHEEIADVLDPVYDALGAPFDPGSVGSVERAGGRADPEMVIEVLESMLVDDAEHEVRRVDE